MNSRLVFRYVKKIQIDITNKATLYTAAFAMTTVLNAGKSRPRVSPPARSKMNNTIMTTMNNGFKRSKNGLTVSFVLRLDSTSCLKQEMSKKK
jgi:hypothetical protein